MNKQAIFLALLRQVLIVVRETKSSRVRYVYLGRASGMIDLALELGLVGGVGYARLLDLSISASAFGHLASQSEAANA